LKTEAEATNIAIKVDWLSVWLNRREQLKGMQD